MKCEVALEWIQRELDKELTSEEKALLRRHLSTCTACAAEAERLRRLSDRLARLPRVTPPHSVVDRLIESGRLPDGKTPREKGVKRGFRWWIGGAAAAAVMVIGTLGLWGGWFGTGSPHPGDPQTLMMNPETMQEAAPPSENMVMSTQGTDSSAVSAWSPDGRFLAEAEGNQVVIRTADGKEWFRSKPWEEGSAPLIHWLSPTVLRVEIGSPKEGEAHREVRIIEVETKRERTENRSRGDGG